MTNPIIAALASARAKRGWSTEQIEPTTPGGKAAAVAGDDEQPSEEVKAMLSPKRMFAILIARD